MQLAARRVIYNNQTGDRLIGNRKISKKIKTVILKLYYTVLLHWKNLVFGPLYNFEIAASVCEMNNCRMVYISFTFLLLLALLTSTRNNMYYVG